MVPEFKEEEFYESIPVSLRVTGSTGTNPLQDGGVRTAFLAIPAGVLYFLQSEYEILSVDGYAALATLMIPSGILAWALFDKFIRSRFITP